MVSNNSRSANPPVREVDLSRGALLVLGMLLGAPWMLLGWLAWGWLPRVAARPAAFPAAVEVSGHPAAEARLARPGPWGRLQLTPINITVPPEFVFTDLEDELDLPWVFPGWSAEQVMELLDSSGLSGAQRRALADPARWKITRDGCEIRPDAETVYALTAAARARIYDVLGRFPQNRHQHLAIVFDPDTLDELMARSGLRPESLEQFRHLLYPRGDALLLADLYLLMSRLPDEEERVRVGRLASAKHTYMVRLQVDPDTDVDELMSYWSSPGRSKDLRPLLESLTRVPGGCSLDLAHLLPQFARRLIYTYDLPSADARLNGRDCHWTAYNFFNTAPDDRFADVHFVNQVFDSQYDPVSGPPRFGDLIVLMDPGGRVLHSAIYIADDLVFCRNSTHFTQPWMLMTLAEMEKYHGAICQPAAAVRSVAFRRKEN
jgi:hypothetical protein